MNGLDMKVQDDYEEKSSTLQQNRSDWLLGMPLLIDFIHHNLVLKATTVRVCSLMSWRIVGSKVHSIFCYQKKVCHQKQHFGPDWIRVLDAFLVLIFKLWKRRCRHGCRQLSRHCHQRLNFFIVKRRGSEKDVNSIMRQRNLSGNDVANNTGSTLNIDTFRQRREDKILIGRDESTQSSSSAHAFQC